MSTISAPEISIELSIEPASFSPGDNVEICLTLVSEGPAPITIYTYPSIFNLQLAQQRRNFFCIDLDTNNSIDMELTKGGKRNGFINFALGGKDEKYFHTLNPDQPVVFRSRFQIANRHAAHVENAEVLIPGHRYAFGIREGEVIRRWWKGRKQDLMAPRGQRQACPAPSGPPIVLDSIANVEFEVRTA